MTIQPIISQFMENRTLDGRETSFDFCYNYFKSFSRDTATFQTLADENNIEKSCLHLGFYLASWGMLRGSSILLQKCFHYYKPVIEALSNLNPVEYYTIDVDNYNIFQNEQKIISCYETIRHAFLHEPTVTQITKIMLGVFGIFPAIDTNFNRSFKIYKVNSQSINQLFNYYDQNRQEIDSQCIYTIDFHGNNTENIYKKAKIIDMIGWIQGI